MGAVYTIHPDCSGAGPSDPNYPGTVEGTPQAAHPDLEKAAHASQVVALSFVQNQAGGYDASAVSCDLVTGEYNVFKGTPPPAFCDHPFADADGDTDVDQADFAIFQACYTGSGHLLDPVSDPRQCKCFDILGPTGPAEGNVDQSDLVYFEQYASGPGIEADPACDPVGACCLGGVTCDELTASECRNQGGVPQGPGSTCATVACQ